MQQGLHVLACCGNQADRVAPAQAILICEGQELVRLIAMTSERGFQARNLVAELGHAIGAEKIDHRFAAVGACWAHCREFARTPLLPRKAIAL